MKFSSKHSRLLEKNLLVFGLERRQGRDMKKTILFLVCCLLFFATIPVLAQDQQEGEREKQKDKDKVVRNLIMKRPQGSIGGIEALIPHTFLDHNHTPTRFRPFVRPLFGEIVKIEGEQLTVRDSKHVQAQLILPYAFEYGSKTVPCFEVWVQINEQGKTRREQSSDEKLRKDFSGRWQINYCKQCQRVMSMYRMLAPQSKQDKRKQQLAARNFVEEEGEKISNSRAWPMTPDFAKHFLRIPTRIKDVRPWRILVPVLGGGLYSLQLGYQLTFSIDDGMFFSVTPIDFYCYGDIDAITVTKESTNGCKTQTKQSGYFLKKKNWKKERWTLMVDDRPLAIFMDGDGKQNPIVHLWRLHQYPEELQP